MARDFSGSKDFIKLSDEEVKKLSEDPYQVFNPEFFRRTFTPKEIKRLAQGEKI